MRRRRATRDARSQKVREGGVDRRPFGARRTPTVIRKTKKCRFWVGFVAMEEEQVKCEAGQLRGSFESEGYGNARRARGRGKAVGGIN